jgi:hypothetical protein
MGGTPHGMHSIVINTGTHDNYYDCMVGIYNALEYLRTQGICERVSLYTNGTGMDWKDGANPIGNDGFFVYRWPFSFNRPNWAWEIMFEWHEDIASRWAAAGQNWTPSLVRANDTGEYIGCQVATAFDVNDEWESPWEGTRNFDLADYKGTTQGGSEAVWGASASGTCHVFPRSNNTGGTHDSLKQNCSAIFFRTAAEWDDSAKRIHVIADDDSLWLSLDGANNGIMGGWILVTQFNRATGVPEGAPPNPPLVVLSPDNASRFEPQTYGSTGGNTSYEGGIVAPNPGQVLGVYPSAAVWEDATYHPNAQRSSTYYDEGSPVVSAQEAPYKGLMGELDPEFTRSTYDVPRSSTFNSMGRVIFGNNQAELKLSVPWDETTANPDAASTRDGVTF